VDDLTRIDTGFDRDVFLRALLGELATTLQNVVGVDEAAGYISIVGGAMGQRFDNAYRKALKVEHLSREQIAQVLVDLKRRLGGDFRVVEEREDRIVLANTSCPFGEFVKGRPSLCMMTSNVFGYITAENLGYSRVRIDKAIARGDPGCLVTVFLTPSEEPDEAREYFRRIQFAPP
jgi:predicted ArsR family transcriptional regulator